MNDKQQRAWDEVTRAHRALEHAMYRLVMLPDDQRMHALEAGVDAAKDTLLKAAAMQKDREAQARLEAETRHCARCAGIGDEHYAERGRGRMGRYYDGPKVCGGCNSTGRVPKLPRCGKQGCTKPATQRVHGSLTYDACDDHAAEIEELTANE